MKLEYFLLFFLLIFFSLISFLVLLADLFLDLFIRLGQSSVCSLYFLDSLGYLVIIRILALSILAFDVI